MVIFIKYQNLNPLLIWKKKKSCVLCSLVYHGCVSAVSLDVWVCRFVLLLFSAASSVLFFERKYEFLFYSYCLFVWWMGLEISVLMFEILLWTKLCLVLYACACELGHNLYACDLSLCDVLLYRKHWNQINISCIMNISFICAAMTV